MTPTTIERVICLHGGPPGGSGHQVPPEKMVTIIRGRVKIPIYFDCRKRKLSANNF